MSYYKKGLKFKVSDHARVRIKQRLNIKATLDFEIDDKINEILEGLVPEFSNNGHDYYKIPKRYNFYAIVDSASNVVLSVGEMTNTKKGNLF
ncbi:hypothetical protein [[Mycoplasma] testudinis]|uniref:hypothetical protein n=1 Tax=[Mycoplasma] testudinis TaxID=33924 RepID=UPI0004848FF2|nr:hypothetical protein [[Mycoplasma] testudinis]